MHQSWRKLRPICVSLTFRQLSDTSGTAALNAPKSLGVAANVPGSQQGIRSWLFLLLSVITFGVCLNAAHAQVINFPSGFADSSSQVWLENFATLNGSLIHLVPSKVHNGSNAWFKTPENVQSFTTTFTFHIDCSADKSDCGGGFGFMMICACSGGNPTYDPANGHPGFTYSGFSGAQFSWSQCEQPLTPAGTWCYNNPGVNSNGGSDLKKLPDNIIVTFDNYDNGAGVPGASLTTYATNGVFPARPVTTEYDMAPSGINLNSGHLFSATLTYNGSTLTEVLTDTVTGAQYTHAYAANIPAAITGNTAFIGFGGGTGAALDDIYIHSWTYTPGDTGSGSPAATSTPTFSPAAGTYSSAQSVNISDSTAGAAIYYTTNGSTPTTSSTKKTGAIMVGSTETLKAIAVASGYASSPIAIAAYTMSSDPVTATPAFSPAAGTYTSAQSVTISEATSGATVYYTTDGSTPTTSSTKYTGVISVGSTEKLEAIAVASNHANSAVSSAAYTISASSGSGSTGSDTVIYYPSFAGSPGGVKPINNAYYSGSTIQLTSLAGNETSNAYFIHPVNVQAFTTSFTWTAKCPGGSSLCGDGMGFTIISATNPKSPNYWSGGSGGQLAWSSGCTASGTNCETLKSILIKFDLYNLTTHSDKANLTGLYTAGEYPQAPNAEYDMAPSGINMESGHLMRATLTYNGATLYETVSDTVTNATYSRSYSVNIPSQVGGNTAIVGFSGGSGAASVQQNIDSWTYTVQSPVASATPAPTFSPAAGVASSGQPVTISDATSGAAIYYTTNGTTPNTSSTRYTSPITVSSGQTLRAMAVASGQAASVVASATYAVSSEAQVATPTFSPPAGTYATTQSVTIEDATLGATGYYTTNGTTPTTSSTKYTGPITVSASERLQAIVVAPGHPDSAVASAAYTLTGSATQPHTVIDFANGFSGSPSTIETVNAAYFSGSAIQLTSAREYEAGNTYFKTPVNVQKFTTSFTWTAKCPGGGTACGDGMGFVIISTTNPKSPSYWSGGSGSQLAWSDNCTTPSSGRTNCTDMNSVFVKFDMFNQTTGAHTANLTGIYAGGQIPQPPNPQYDMAPSGINMQSGDLMRATLAYDGTTLYETVTDTVTNHTYTNHYTVNIPSLVEGNTAIVGFAGATGTSNAQQDIESWTYTVQ